MCPYFIMSMYLRESYTIKTIDNVQQERVLTKDPV